MQKFFSYHRVAQSKVTMFVHPNDRPYDSDIVTTDDDLVVRQIRPHPHTEDTFTGNLVNAAIYIVERDVFANVNNACRKLDFAQQLIPEILESNTKVVAYNLLSLQKIWEPQIDCRS